MDRRIMGSATRQDGESSLEKEDVYSEVEPENAGLQAENLKLQKRIVKLEAQIITLHNRIKALEEDRKENRPIIHFSMDLGGQNGTLKE